MPARNLVTEHDEQVALFEWAALSEKNHPELKWMFAIPNGGQRHIVVAKKLKDEGVKPGVPDIFLPKANKKYLGLFIEMKVGKNKLTQNQETWIEALSQLGYACAVCYSVEEAIVDIEEYLCG